ncbi:hypothetical protein LLG39_14880 [bacterium]|nr:hypothetical protein [bacterium]
MKQKLIEYRIWAFMLVITTVMTVALAVCAIAAPNISPDQRDQLKSLAIETRRKAGIERKAIMFARTDLARVYWNYDIDDHKANAAMDRLDKAQQDLLNIHFDSQVQIRRVLNEDQFNHLRSKIGRQHNGFGAGFTPRLDDPMDKALQNSLQGNSDLKKRLAGQKNLINKRNELARKIGRDAKQMANLYSQYNLDEAAVQKLITSIHSKQNQLSDINHKRQQQIRSVLSESEFVKLRDTASQKIKQDGRFGRKQWRNGG